MLENAGGLQFFSPMLTADARAWLHGLPDQPVPPIGRDQDRRGASFIAQNRQAEGKLADARQMPACSQSPVDEQWPREDSKMTIDLAGCSKAWPQKRRSLRCLDDQAAGDGVCWKPIAAEEGCDKLGAEAAAGCHSWHQVEPIKIREKAF